MTLAQVGRQGGVQLREFIPQLGAWRFGLEDVVFEKPYLVAFGGGHPYAALLSPDPNVLQSGCRPAQASFSRNAEPPRVLWRQPRIFPRGRDLGWVLPHNCPMVLESKKLAIFGVIFLGVKSEQTPSRHMTPAHIAIIFRWHRTRRLPRG